MPTITPCLWFDTRAEEAANFYVTVFPNSRILEITHYGPNTPMPEGTVLTVEFELDGQRYTALNGGPQFTFDEAVSFQIDCESQEDVDRYWEALTADGGEESQCGWLKDKFGVSWQVVPRELIDLIFHSDPVTGNAAMQAMMTMRKLDLAVAREAVAAAQSGS
ncbi:3-demethylubiquinone-9 3-methyltransferase [Mycobacteroides salmoniphilum]|uniref:3-demethylubiquinone-9 3-methyltransferase n=1 Tax=Mycobacteroides salmoniphilum TaxID=404941 RepID=A0A4R8RXU0_9MYCO|nr:VOC family protein [Mycobacteroides salmoniphilum]TDZ79129.1 3-demethylubiquinone-9 3-methyltransferase [Mycobacteroides salmoniphilum]TDZ81205.1 3-demethylubiquinone-9 3-methyltransferase [Mycobacteroides salmoniphilum]TDZ88705.1 3-demethylubiquinone-9 3-methyltransferase [Mycobacteroides salmoniphilum]